VSARIINEIAAASLEQKQGINQVNSAIADMDTMTQQNASLVEETASASEEMANQAQELMVMVQKFKIRNGIGEEAAGDKRTEPHIHAAGTGESEKAGLPKSRNGNGRKFRGKPGAHIIDAGNPDEINAILDNEGFEKF
jgi:methyl-accepting chemotaxis protein